MAFKLKSGNNTNFKMMGSSPTRQDTGYKPGMEPEWIQPEKVHAEGNAPDSALPQNAFTELKKTKAGKYTTKLLKKLGLPLWIGADVAMDDRDDLNVAEKTVDAVYDNTLGFANEIVSDLGGLIGLEIPVWSPFDQKKPWPKPTYGKGGTMVNPKEEEKRKKRKLKK